MTSSESYNLPDWEGSPEGLNRCLESLFQVTPPTAILFDDRVLDHAIRKFLSRKSGAAFRRVVCIPTEYHSSFEWAYPGSSYISWDSKVLIRSVLRWADRVASGEAKPQQTSIKANFVDGGDLALAGI